MAKTETSVARQAFRFVVLGRVQGVFFRDTTRAAADRFGVSGWVRNRADGGVEGEAAGSPEALEELRGFLDRGPAQARVDTLEIVPVKRVPRFRGFEIRK